MGEYISLKQFAEMAGIQTATLSAYRSRGQGKVPDPDMTIDGHNFWHVSTANEWISDRES